MFKRVERKRKRREEEEGLGLDEDVKEIMGLNDTDSDESDSDSDPGFGEEVEDDAALKDEGVDEDPPISVEDALKDPIYLISFDPTIHGCVLCKGKLIKNAGMAAVHKNANVHRRRFEQFRLLSADADPHSNVWDLVRGIQSKSSVQKVESQESSRRALKRQAKQAAICEKRRRHKQLKAKAIAKKALRNISAADETRPVLPEVNLRCSPSSRYQPGKTRKKQRVERKTSTSKVRDATAKATSRTKNCSSNNMNLKSDIKSARTPNKPL